MHGDMAKQIFFLEFQVLIGRLKTKIIYVLNLALDEGFKSL